MQEVKGNIWDFHAKGNWIGITTNHTVLNSGKAVMGRGVAKQASIKYPNLPKQFGESIKNNKYNRSIFIFPEYRLFTFQVKYNWWELARLELIDKSAKELRAYMKLIKLSPVYLPKPGCGNGLLKWKQVKPILDKYFKDDNRLFIVDYK